MSGHGSGDERGEGASGAFDALEARLAALKEKMARGLPQRADEIDLAVGRLEGGDEAARDEVRRLAHKLRGIAGSYGFPELGELAAEVEQLARDGGASVDVLARARALSGAARAAGPGGATSAPLPEVAPDPAAADPAPAPPAAAAPRAKAAMPSPAPELEGLVVLAADDDDATRRLLEITLGQLGRMRATLFDRAPRLLEQLAAAERVDLVVVDAMMPDMNGLELLRAVVDRGLQSKAAHFAVLSAATADELGWELPPELKVGWLRKPFRPKDLLVALVALRASGTPPG
jgi:CheY-like chemotaxis protein/HPt (histidine-containing phosphotransfer) domain-containing protein